MEITFNDEPGPRDRETKLLIVADSKPYWFAGRSDSNVTVLGSQYIKDGKWSRTIYRLAVVDGVRTLVVRRGWETGRWREGFLAALGLPAFAGWEAVAKSLEVSVDTLIAGGKVIIP